MFSSQTVPAAIGGRVDAAEPLTHNEGNAATGGIWRVRGPAGTAILKVARPPSPTPVGRPAWQTSDEPTHWNYWRREVLAYETGFAAEVYAPAGIAPPPLLEVAERPDGCIELWQAEATGAPGMSWPVDRIGDFARRLGAAQSRWIDRVPEVPWLSRRWLAQYLSHGPAHAVSTVDWDHPVAAAWPGAVRAELRRLWAERHRVLALVESFPRTVCHLDMWPNNLIGDVLVDWSFVGEGAAGEDPANLIVDSVADGLMDMTRLPAIADAVIEGYVTGLREGGYPGPADGVRRAIMAGGAAKYCWLGPAVLGRVARGATVGHPEYSTGSSGTEALLRLRDLVTLIADWSAAVR